MLKVLRLFKLNRPDGSHKRHLTEWKQCNDNVLINTYFQNGFGFPRCAYWDTRNRYFGLRYACIKCSLVLFPLVLHRQTFTNQSDSIMKKKAANNKMCIHSCFVSLCRTWTNDSCNLVSFEESTGVVTCKCNHLTNFAVLMSPIDLSNQVRVIFYVSWFKHCFDVRAYVCAYLSTIFILSLSGVEKILHTFRRTWKTSFDLLFTCLFWLNISLSSV